MAIKNKDIDLKYKGKAFFTTVLRSVAETNNILGDVTSKVITTADTVYDPIITVSEPKNFEGKCKIPLGTWDMSEEAYQLKRYVGNAIADCEVDLESVEYNVKDYQTEALIAGIKLKLNKNNVADLVAKATPEPNAIDLTTLEKVQKFVLGVQSNHTGVIVAKNQIDNGRYKNAPKQGKPFIAASSEVINHISALLGATNVATASTSDLGRILETVGGVLLIDLRDASDVNNRIIYGTAGAPSQLMREDYGFGVKLVSGKITSKEQASAVDLEIAQGDDIITETSYFGGKIKTELHVFKKNKGRVWAGTATI